MTIKKTAIGVAAIIIVAGIFMFFLNNATSAETEFDKMKEAAKYCTNPTSTDPKCAQSFEQLRKDSEHMQAQKSV